MNDFENYRTRFVQSVGNKKGEVATSSGMGATTLTLGGCVIFRAIAEWKDKFKNDGLIRISIGLENPQDIIEDFIKAA